MVRVVGCHNRQTFINVLQLSPVYFLLLLLPWFFIGGPDYESWRVFKEAWNLGHILFFAIFALEADRHLRSRRLCVRPRYIWVLLLVLGLASGIEVCQLFLSGREASFRDIILGLAGGFAVLVWKDTAEVTANRKILLRVLGSSGIAICMVPLLFTVFDDYRLRRDFPVLSDFESFLDVSRWEGKDRVARVREPVKIGRFSLMVPLTTEKYSGIFLHHFLGNWRGARVLSFSVYNPGETVALHYRVHDSKHQGNNQEYSNRFNGHVDLGFGWNTITVGMEAIENGPKSRKMDLEHIRGFGLFVVDQPVERVLYLDDVKLLMKD